MLNQTRAYLLGLAAVLLWSTVASAFKISLRYLDPLQLLLYATAASTLLLAGILTCRGRLGAILSCTRRDFATSILLGFLNPFLYYLVLFEAYDLLPAQEAQPLNYTWALTLAILSIPLLKQKLRPADLAAGLICYSGVLVIATRGDLLSFRFSDPLGVGLALGSTVIWALYWIYNTRDKLDPVLRLFLNFLFSMPFVLAACLLFSEISVTDSRGYLGAAYVGLFEMGLTFVLWLSALRLSASTARIANLIFLSPFLSLLFIHLFVGEEIVPSTLVGLALIMGGLLVQRLKARTADGS